MIVEKDRSMKKDKENSTKKGTRKVALQTYFWICLCVVFFVMIICPDKDVGKSTSESAKDYDEHVDIKRSPLLSSSVESSQPLEHYDAQCAGSRVYMYELPVKFNTGLAKLCGRELVDWLDLCRYFHNGGFGTKVEVDDDEGWTDWYGTDAYMLEVIFHARMQTYPCRTYEPSRADAFFIPWYSGLDALPWLYNKRITVPTRGRFGIEIFKWLENDAGEWWRRYGGRDHFLVLGRTAWDFFLDEEDDLNRWGTGFFSLPYARNLTSLLLESRQSWYDNERAIPYPTSFHPSSSGVLSRWIQKAKNARRDYLMSYAGAPRPQMDDSIRGIIGSQCADAVGKICFFVDCSVSKCSHDPIPISNSLLRSNFCLQPRGDTATRRSTFDCIIAGSIPVFFHEDTAYTQYGWHLPEDGESYSVYIPEAHMRRGVLIETVLKSYSPERIREMRKNVLALIPSLVYNSYANLPRSETKDAFELSVRGVIDGIAAYKSSHPSF